MLKKVELRGFLARKPLNRHQLFYIPCNILFEDDFEVLCRYRVLGYNVCPLMLIDEVEILTRRKPYILRRLYKYGVWSLCVLAEKIREIENLSYELSGVFKIISIILRDRVLASIPGVETYKYFYTFQREDNIDGLVICLQLYERFGREVRRVDHGIILKNLLKSIGEVCRKCSHIKIIVDILDKAFQ